MACVGWGDGERVAGDARVPACECASVRGVHGGGAVDLSGIAGVGACGHGADEGGSVDLGPVHLPPRGADGRPVRFVVPLHRAQSIEWFGWRAKEDRFEQR